MDEQAEAALRAAIDPYRLQDPERRQLYSSFTYEPYTSAELDIAEEDFGHKFPASYRYVFEHYDGLDLGQRDYCGRQGINDYVRATSLMLPWRSGWSYEEGWFNQVRHDLRRTEYLLPHALQLLPLAYGESGAVICLDLAFDADDPPVVKYSPTEYPAYQKLSFIADTLVEFFKLTVIDEPQPDRECDLSESYQTTCMRECPQD